VTIKRMDFAPPKMVEGDVGFETLGSVIAWHKHIVSNR